MHVHSLPPHEIQPHYRHHHYDFGALKECTLKEISLFYFDPAKLMDILLFKKNLIATLEKKSILSDFRTKPIYPKGTAPKKKSVIDEAKERNAKDPPELKAQFNEEFTKRCTPWAKEKDIQADLNKIALDLDNSPYLEIDDDNIVVCQQRRVRHVLKCNFKR